MADDNTQTNTQTQTQTEEPQDLSDMLVDDAEIEAAEEAAEAQSQQPTDNAQSSEAEPSDSAQTSEAASTAGEGDQTSGPPLPGDPPSQDSPSTATSDKTEVQTQPADAGAQQTTDTAPPPDQSQVQPQSAEAILQSMGLLPEGFEVPAGAEGEQPTQTQVQPQTQQPAPPVQTQQQQPPEQTQTQTQPEQTQTQPTLEQVRNQQIEELARTQYALDKDTVEVLEAEGNTELAKLVPQIASRVFVDAVQATMANLAQMLPGILDQRETQRAESAKYEEAFYSFWDSRGFDLREHEGDLRSIGQAYRSVNPTGKADEFITNVGAQLIIAKQLTPKEQKGGGRSGQQQQPTNGNVEQAQQQTQQPFQSAGTTGAPHTPPPRKTAFQEFFEEVESADFDE